MARALVTGASAGIGRAFAEQLAERGQDLILIARREDQLQELAARLRDKNVEVEVLAADLASEAGLAAVRDRIATGPLCDLVVNNAGFARREMVADMDLGGFEAMLRVNVLALAGLSAAALQRLSAERRGAIINVSSGTVFMQMPGNAGYGASKNFVMAFTRHMQVEAQAAGVQVQLLIPGIVATEFHGVAGADLAHYPPGMVMQAGDLVAASLKALDTGEAVCIPSLPDVRDWEGYVSAEQAIMPNVSRDRLADRYG